MWYYRKIIFNRNKKKYLKSKDKVNIYKIIFDFLLLHPNYINYIYNIYYLNSNLSLINYSNYKNLL